MKTPMLAHLAEGPFDSKEWLFEIKWDGYRAIASKKNQVSLVSRNNLSFNDRFPGIVKELEKIPGKFSVDGEIVLLDSKGRSKFQLMQNYQRTKTGTPIYYLFDITSYNGKDVTGLPLVERKALLKKLLGKTKWVHLRYSDHIFEKGTAFFQKAKKMGLEGIMGKRADSAYLHRRSRDWLKIKAILQQEAVIGGFTEPKGSRKRFGALLVGVYEKKKFRYVGHVGTGFDEKLLDEIYRLLKKNISKTCPFVNEPHPNSPVTWVRPKLVCEVAFAEWTNDGIMRQPRFIGMRFDKSPKEVARE